MTVEEINKNIVTAEECANTVQNKELKASAFELVLGHLLSADRKSLRDEPTDVPNDTDSLNVNRTGPAAKVAAWLGVEISDVEDLFEFGENDIVITMSHDKLPKGIADAQRFLTLVKTAVLKTGYGTSDVSGKDMIAVCDYYSCKDKNFAANIKDWDKFIEGRAAKKGATKTYRIRKAGLDKAKEDLNNVFSS